jgi:RNA polymerase sigma factor (TIGR02999 family)
MTAASIDPSEPARSREMAASRDLTEVARLLQQQAGDSDRIEIQNRIFELAYAELHRIAEHLMRNERAGHTLQPTAIVHEAYVRLIGGNQGIEWTSRAHFFGTAARAMRQILVDHARKRAAAKRGGDLQRVTFDDRLGGREQHEHEILALNEALEVLASEDSRAARVVELRLFAGLQIAEIAHVVGVSSRTVEGDWLFARKWLERRLS